MVIFHSYVGLPEGICEITISMPSAVSEISRQALLQAEEGWMGPDFRPILG